MTKQTVPSLAVFQLLSHRPPRALGVGMFQCHLSYVEERVRVETNGINKVEIQLLSKSSLWAPFI